MKVIVKRTATDNHANPPYTEKEIEEAFDMGQGMVLDSYYIHKYEKKFFLLSSCRNVEVELVAIRVRNPWEDEYWKIIHCMPTEEHDGNEWRMS